MGVSSNCQLNHGTREVTLVKAWGNEQVLFLLFLAMQANAWSSRALIRSKKKKKKKDDGGFGQSLGDHQKVL